MDINNVKLLGSPGQNVVIETAGRVYIKVQDRFYEVDFRNLGKSSSTTNVTNTYSEKPDLSGYVSKDYLKSALSQYVTTKTWQSVKATQAALQNSGLSGFTDSISPITIDTMQLLVGAEQLQYDFVDHLGHYTEAPLLTPPQYAGVPMPTLGDLSSLKSNDPFFADSFHFIAPKGIIKHYVYNGPEAVQSGMQDFQYSRWVISDSFDPKDPAEKYYFQNLNTVNWASGKVLNDNDSAWNGYTNFDINLMLSEKVYYLYIQASYLSEEITRTFEPASQSGASWDEWWTNEVGSKTSFTFSELLKVYDNLLGLKKALWAENSSESSSTWDNIWGTSGSSTYWGLEHALINALYEFKVGKAHYVLSEAPLKEYEYDGEEGEEIIIAYNFLYAIVGNNGSSGRSITTLNGFTEITPGQVTAYIFKTPDGQQYINFKEGSLHIGEPYDNKKGEWMHYNPDTGLEISGKLTVTGGGLQKELDYLDKLASGEFNIFYSDDALTGSGYYGAGYLPAWGAAPPPSGNDDDSGNGEDSGGGDDETSGGDDSSTQPAKSYNQYIPFPNDSKKSTDTSWYERINWPAADWSSVEEKESHLGDLYVVSRDIPWNNGTDKIEEDDIDPNYAYDTDSSPYNEAKLIFRYIKTEEPTGENGKNQDTYYWTVAESSLLNTLITNYDDYGYLKKALNNSTTIAGGLILTSAIGLGYSDIEDEQVSKDSADWTLTAGLSGIVGDDIYKTDIAAWYGGKMDDPIQYLDKNKPSDSSQGHINQNYKAPDSQGGVSYPQTLFRHDGSGYIGGLEEVNGVYIPAIYWDSENLSIRDDVIVKRSNGNPITLGELGSNFFKLVYIISTGSGTVITDTKPSSSSVNYTTAVKLKSTSEGGGAGIISDGFISAFGYSGSEGGSGSGDASWPDDPHSGDFLIWDTDSPTWADPSELSVGFATEADTANSATTAITSSYLASPGLILWGNSNIGTNGNMNCGTTGSVKSLSYVGNINFTDDGTSGVYLSTTAPTGVSSYQNTLYVRGNLVATGFISAFGTSSSGGSSSGDANSIAGKLVIEPQSWSGLDGKSLVYDASENSGEGAWVIGDAGIQWPSGANTGYLLRWGSNDAEWVNPSSISVGSLITSHSIWGQQFNGTQDVSGNMSGVGNITFSSSPTFYLPNNGRITISGDIYVTGHIIADSYISAYGTSSSGGSSSGDASSIGGKDVNISNLSDGQILMYDLLDDEWKNVDPDVIPIITLNGSGTSSASFYAPTTWGSSAQVLVGNGSGNAPTWTNISSLSVGSSNYANTAGELDDTCYLWGNAFKGNNDIGTVSSPASLSNVGDIGLVNGRSLYIDKYPAGNGALQILTMASDNQLVVGYGLLHSASSSAQYNTYIDGYTVHLRTSKNGDAHVDSVVIEHNGSTSFKNDIGVAGSIVSTGGVSIGGGLTVTGGATVGGIFNASSSANIGYNLVVGSENVSGYGNLTVRGNYIYIGGTAYYLKYEANGGSPYLHTNLPIVSDGFISAYGVSTTSSGTNSGGNNSGGEPGEEPIEEPVTEPYEEPNN